MKLRDLLARAKRQLNPFSSDSPFQFTAASISFWFGLWLLLPASSFAATPAWNIIAKLMPENVLGIIILSLGLCQFVTMLLLYNRAARVLAFLSVFLWSAISYSFWLSSPASTGSVIYPHVVLVNAVIFVRLSAK